MSKMNRRKFLKNSLLGSTALGIALSLFNVAGDEA
jgi:anaerobic selenocysteine-containing dehydrogenase